MHHLAAGAGWTNDRSDLRLGPECIPQAWHALSALASEQQHVFGSLFDVTPIETPGAVQQQRENASEGNRAAAPPNAEDRYRAQSPDNTAQASYESAVQAEVEDVQQRAISTDPETEVVLRFDFLNGRDSRVRLHLYHLHAQ